MSSWKFTLTPTLKLAIAEEVKTHRANPNWKKDKSTILSAVEKVLAMEKITEKVKVETTKKVSSKSSQYLLDIDSLHSGYFPILCQQYSGPVRTKTTGCQSLT